MEYDCVAKGHIGKVLKDEYRITEDRKDMIPVTILWGCTECDAISPEKWADFGIYDVTKKECKDDCNCFGCKVKTLQMNTGDATRDISDKKWTAELSAYRDARDQGMQPAGTSMRHIQEAYKASETLGKAYNSETMPKAKDINTKSVEVLKEIGQI